MAETSLTRGEVTALENVSAAREPGSPEREERAPRAMLMRDGRTDGRTEPEAPWQRRQGRDEGVYGSGGGPGAARLDSKGHCRPPANKPDGGESTRIAPRSFSKAPEEDKGLNPRGPRVNAPGPCRPDPGAPVSVWRTRQGLGKAFFGPHAIHSLEEKEMGRKVSCPGFGPLII